MVGCAVSVCSAFRSWFSSWLVARLVLLVHCCLRRRSASIGGDWLSVVLSYPGRTGRHPRRVWCFIPCFCFAGVVALPLVLTCSPSTFLCLRGCRPCAGVRCRLLLRPPPRTPPHLTPQLVVFGPSLCFLVSPHPPAVVPPPPTRWFSVSRPLVFCSAFSLVPSAPCGCCAPLGRLSVPPAVPPDPRICVARVFPLPLVLLCSPSAF